MSPGLRFNQLAGTLVTLLAVFPCAGCTYNRPYNFECFVNDEIYENGEVVATPTRANLCHRVTCIDGCLRSVADGCLEIWSTSGVCRPRGYVVVVGCLNFTCDQSANMVRTRAACEDNNGVCHNVGSTLVAHVLGKLRQCTCNIHDRYSMMLTCGRPT
ncbi:hypothetical protein BsWGS_03419 [Bradybaena similaris]